MATAQQGARAGADYEEPTGWVGWILFAAVMMIIGGGLNMLYGIVALVNDTWVGWNSVTSNAVVVDITTWGWIQLIVGLIVVCAGFGVLSGNILARTIGVVIAGLSLIANFFFIPVYPLWAITVMVIDLLIIWALTAHGRELKND